MIFVTRTKLPPIHRYYKYLQQIWANNWVTNNGQLVQELELKLRDYLKVYNLALVTNATLALQMAFKSLNITEGEVITTPFTFAATTNVILWEKLKPVFADIDPETFNINPEEIEKKITKNTRAILAVHVYGNPCAVDHIKEIALKHNLKVIYDAAHAFGVEYNGSSVLNHGDVSVLSFHATKVFNTIEGGALVSPNQELDGKQRLLRNFGIVNEEKVVLPGTNAKMNEFQAAMGLCNLQTINRDIRARDKMYHLYLSRLGKIKELKFQKLVASRYNYSYMPVLHRDIKHRDLIYDRLKENGIHARKYFYPLTSSLDYFNQIERDDYKKNLPVATFISNRVLCLPLYAGLTEEIVKQVVDLISKYS
ncbi:MAG: hypothetical protein A3I38_02290 [Candidatus Wildermuthbacteria bacterium RIFCSPLOWO2_02_FULL_47_10]|uniref:Aminotransferase n=1 Tax=Candidatus Wildermuthbacteria bacterium RIFCSPHIGHO2_02_FULL_47_17 TaxID=1802452 RepID=A0A1G2R7F7_9BACT|nr:MAG: hypothetical protein A3D59_01150 [Candidatus Wildermuthbacteria bacterium RIFCSPHIGHO2_02_FULL_47_17]OHA75693.1 MAG: hypothetical protein A3I38_02290 [Candidatus Wildermuthbacteria bacterium RIFCSPLOWO2_02_FULL_47_10]